MQEEISILKREFERIKNIGWIKEKCKSLGSCGYTFEKMLHKEDDNFPVPDFNNIEIKVMNDHAKTNLHLFNLIPDGDYLFPIDRLLYQIGCPDKDNKNWKRLYKTFNAKEYTRMIYGQKAIISVNYENKKVELLVYNHRNENTNIGISWSFDYIKERLLLKLKYLAFIKTSSCIICGEGYYHYHKMDIYKLKDFDTFINLIDLGIIEITFKVGVHKSGSKIGKVYDHGTDFSVNPTNIELLYDKIA